MQITTSRISTLGYEAIILPNLKASLGKPLGKGALSLAIRICAFKSFIKA